MLIASHDPDVVAACDDVLDLEPAAASAHLCNRTAPADAAPQRPAARCSGRRDGAGRALGDRRAVLGLKVMVTVTWIAMGAGEQLGRARGRREVRAIIPPVGRFSPCRP